MTNLCKGLVERWWWMLYVAARDFVLSHDLTPYLLIVETLLNTTVMRFFFSLSLFLFFFFFLETWTCSNWLNSPWSEPCFKQIRAILLCELEPLKCIWHRYVLKKIIVFALNWPLPTFDCCTSKLHTVIGAKWMEFILFKKKQKKKEMLSQCLIPVKGD